MKVTQTYDVGVIVGRFQVPDLHRGHVDLIQSVVDTHDKVVLFLGLSPLKVTPNNPLDFEARKQMILEMFPRINVLYIKDMPSDQQWSRRLDEMVDDLTSPGQTACLYGGRDSFIERYHGTHETRVLESEVVMSATTVRKEIARSSVREDPAFRAGVIWAASGTFPTAYPVVDIGVFDADSLLLGRKTTDTGLRLPGGFVDPTDPHLEAVCRREVHEETGVDISDPVYVGSQIIDDWRYRGERDVILSNLFAATRLSGHLRAADDLATVEWKSIREINIDRDIEPNHRPLVAKLLEYKKGQP